MPNSTRRLALIALATIVAGGMATAFAVAFPGETEVPAAAQVAQLANDDPLVPVTTPTPKPTPTPTPSPAPTARFRSTAPRPVPRPAATRRPPPAIPPPTPCDEFETDCPDPDETREPRDRRTPRPDPTEEPEGPPLGD